MPFGTTPINSLEYTEYAADPKRKVPGKLWGARKRVYVARKTLSAQAAGSQINMVRIPAGSVLVGGRLEWTAMGSGTVWLGVGDQFICDRFMTRADASASNVTSPTAGVASSCGFFNAISTAQQPLNPAVLDCNSYVGTLWEFTCDTDVILYSSYGGALTGYVKLVVEVAQI